MKENTIIVEVVHHFSSCGQTNSYAVAGESANRAYGISPSDAGFEEGQGDRFAITFKRLPRMKKGTRFPKNPWGSRKISRKDKP